MSSHSDSASVRDLLEIVEAHLAVPAGFVSTSEQVREAEALAASVRALEDAVASRPEEAAALADRLARVRRITALRTRRVPEGALDGVYEAVRARMDGAADDGDAALLRAGLSSSFLDAPRSLALWRRTAVAALVLLAVGLGWWSTGTDPRSGSGSSEGEPLRAYDPRDDLLDRLSPASSAAGPAAPNRSERFVPMIAPGNRTGARPAPRSRYRGRIYVWGGSSAGTWETSHRRMLDALGLPPARGLPAVEEN